MDFLCWQRRYLSSSSLILILPSFIAVIMFHFASPQGVLPPGVISAQSKGLGNEKMPIFGVCDPISDPPQCGNNAVCGVLLPQADICERGVCMCKSPGFAPLFNTNATDCGPLLKPGEQCANNDDGAMLIPEFAQCKDGVVTCAPGLVASTDGASCVPSDTVKTQPGEACDETVKCHEAIGLECVRSNKLNERGLHCQCQSNLVFKDGLCQRALYGDPCTNDEQCNVIYDEVFSGGTRSVCRNNFCSCGTNYIKVNAVIRTPPSNTQLSDVKPNNILGYYCFSSSIAPRMKAGLFENCSMALPNTAFDPQFYYCQPGLVCIHCAESGDLAKGKCVNMTALFAQSGVAMPTEPPPVTTTLPVPHPAKAGNAANGFSLYQQQRTLYYYYYYYLLSSLLSLLFIIATTNSAFGYYYYSSSS